MRLKLMAEIGLDGSGFERGLSKLGREAGASVKNLAVQAFGIYGVEQAIAKTVETANELVNTSKRLDVTVEQLQLLRQAAKDGGTEMGTLASAFEKLDIARAKALSGDKAAIDAFAKLGVSQSQLTTQTAATIFTGSISNAAKSNNVESLAPAFKEVLGKGFGELIPVLKTDFDELSEKMHRLGTIMDTETAVKLKLAAEEFELVSQVATTRLGPALAQLTDWVVELSGKIKQVVAFFGGIFANGPLKGIATLQKTSSDTFASTLPKPIGDIISKISDTILKGAGFEPDDLQKNIDATAQAVREARKEGDAELADWRSKIAKITDEINNPKPIVPDVNAAVEGRRSLRQGSIPSDALLKVGNFLGANGNTISRVDQRKIDLLQKIAKNTEPKASFGLNNLGIPSV